jgi:hypothetical protein
LSKILSQVLILESGKINCCHLAQAIGTLGLLSTLLLSVDSARRQLKLFIAVGLAHQIQTPVFVLHHSADLSYRLRQWARVGPNKFECHAKTSS